MIVDNKGIQLKIIDHQYLHPFAGQICGLQNGARQLLKRVLNIRIA
jgi:hypothetical protein